MVVSYKDLGGNPSARNIIEGDEVLKAGSVVVSRVQTSLPIFSLFSKLIS
jgi:hypothetical protein